MSIYGSFCCLDGDEPDGPAPIVYRGSHILPSDGDPRGGSLDLGSIPPWITRDGRCLAGRDITGCRTGVGCCEEDTGMWHWPWLRVSVRPAQRLDPRAWDRLRRHARQVQDTDPQLAADIRAAADAEDTVILDRAQAARLRDELTDWLATLPPQEAP